MISVETFPNVYVKHLTLAGGLGQKQGRHLEMIVTLHAWRNDDFDKSVVSGDGKKWSGSTQAFNNTLYFIDMSMGENLQ